MYTAIIIPARYGSTRFPGKPLAEIAGQTMLQRVVALSHKAASVVGGDISVHVATDDERILSHCHDIGAACMMTSPICATGTDRVAEAVMQLEKRPDFILNMQGDAPLTPPDFLSAMINSFDQHPCDVVTPVTRLDWSEVDALRQSKETTPFSGTCAVFTKETGRALWFSKHILPAMRHEEKLRAASNFSPVYRHIGLYGYAYDALMSCRDLPESEYERLEGLEQLRMLEAGYHIRCVEVVYGEHAGMSGIDSPEDLARAEALLASLKECYVVQKTRLIIARHGNTFAPGDVVTRVGVTDLPLVSKGEQQAIALGAHLRDAGLLPDMIYTSLLRRTQRMAELLLDQHQLDVSVQHMEFLNEIDYGVDENQPEEQVVARLGRDVIALWDREAIVPDGWRVDIPAIKQGWSNFATDILTHHQGKVILVITSNGIARFASELLEGGMTAFQQSHDLKLATGAFGVFTHNTESGWSCDEWNTRPAR